jgi:hypothetical protein
MIYGYARVSTDTQDCENQKLGVNAEARRRGMMIEKWGGHWDTGRLIPNWRLKNRKSSA